MALIILFVLLGVVLVSTIVVSSIQYNKDNYEEGWLAGVVLGSIILAVLLINIVVTISCQYNDSIYLPQKLIALNETISQQTEYVSNNDVSIGSGLEGTNIKKAIMDTIKERNQLIAEMRFRNISIWYIFKYDIPEEV